MAQEDPEWLELVRDCTDRLLKIESSQDEGLYAKLYQQDVALLVMMISFLSEEPGGAERLDKAYRKAAGN